MGAKRISRNVEHAGGRPAALLRRRTYRRSPDVRAGDAGRPHLGRLHQRGHGARSLRPGRARPLLGGRMVAGGPTNSGHRTPTVIVEAPVDGTSEATVRRRTARSWRAACTSILVASGRETPDAVRAFGDSRYTALDRADEFLSRGLAEPTRWCDAKRGISRLSLAGAGTCAANRGGRNFDASQCRRRAEDTAGTATDGSSRASRQPDVPGTRIDAAPGQAAPRRRPQRTITAGGCHQAKTPRADRRGRALAAAAGIR